MRKGILGLLVLCVLGINTSHGQGPGYQEPMPIQPSGAPYPAAYYPVPTNRYPSYPAMGYPQFVPVQAWPQGVQGWGAPMRYPAPMMRPVYNANTQPPYVPRSTGPGIVQVQAQEPTLFPQVPPLPPSPSTPEKLPFPLPPTPKQDSKAQPDKAPSTSDKQLEPSGEPACEAHADADGPAEPPEPYLVRPEGDWKPNKGYNFYGSLDYLLYKVKKQPLPDNLSLSLSDPNAVPDNTDHTLSGVRFLLGAWINDCQTLGLEGGAFFLFPRISVDSQNFGGSPLAQLRIFNGIVSEMAQLVSWTSFWGAESNMRYEIWRCGCPGSCFHGYLDLLGGIRYVDLSESLTINGSTMFGTGPVLLSNALITTSDTFGTHNHLFGGQIGAEAGFSWKCLSVTGFTKLALGNNHETVSVAGVTSVLGPPVLGNFVAPGGFYAQPSNSGSFSHNEFALLPEVGVNFGYQICDHVRLATGYNFIYFYNAVRPGQEIDPNAGGTRPPLFFLGGARPMPNFSGFNQSAFWAHGINISLEFNY